MNAFRKRADMLVLRVPHLTSFVDLTMPRRNWDAYDEPAHVRLGKKVRIEFERPALVRRQAA